jgi:transposase InsO family protein
MMLDADVVAVSPTSVYRVLKEADVIGARRARSSLKGTGFDQPPRPHLHWHVDVAYINISGTFYFLCSLLDGYSRAIVHWEIGENMGEAAVQTVIQRGLEVYPEERPRIISDNGPQFIAKDFKEFIRLSGMTHVKTSPYYPQSNGKIERWHRSLKAECIRPKVPLSLEHARELVKGYVEHYNSVRLHSAIGYVTPMDRMSGLDQVIWEERDRKLEEARAQRCARRLSARQALQAG